MTTSEGTLDSLRPLTLALLAPAAALVAVLAVTASAASSQTVWYVIRGAGVVAYALLALAVVFGLLITNHVLPGGRPRVDLYEVHIFLSLLALAFTAVHGLALLFDNFISFSPVQVLIPFTSSYRPFAVALGILSLYIALVVYGSFWFRKRIGYRIWRAIHYASFLAFVLAAGHGLLSGTDTGTAWMVAIYATTAAGVAGLVAMRVIAAQAGTPRPA